MDKHCVSDVFCIQLIPQDKDDITFYSLRFDATMFSEFILISIYISESYSCFHWCLILFSGTVLYNSRATHWFFGFLLLLKKITNFQVNYIFSFFYLRRILSFSLQVTRLFFFSILGYTSSSRLLFKLKICLNQRQKWVWRCHGSWGCFMQRRTWGFWWWVLMQLGKQRYSTNSNSEKSSPPYPL